MDKYVTITIKHNKKYNRKLLCVVFNDCEIPYDAEAADQMLNEYGRIIKENPGISVIIDCTGVRKYSTKLIWDKVGKLLSFNELAIKNVCCSAPIMNSGAMVTFMKSITKLYPMVVKNKLCTTSAEALAFIKSCWV